MRSFTRDDQAKVDALHPRAAGMLEEKLAAGLSLDVAITVAKNQHDHDVKMGVWKEEPPAKPLATVEVSDPVPPLAPALAIAEPVPAQPKFEEKISAPVAIAPSVKANPKPATAQHQARRP